MILKFFSNLDDSLQTALLFGDPPVAAVQSPLGRHSAKSGSMVMHWCGLITTWAFLIAKAAIQNIPQKIQSTSNPVKWPVNNTN